MRTRNKILVIVGVMFLILIISICVYFSWFYEPKNAYDVEWDNKENISMDVKETGEKDINDLKENEVEEAKKELTVQEIIREIEKEKPKFNLTVQPNLVAEDKDYIELEEAGIQTAMVKLTPDEKVYPKTIELTEEDIKRLQEYEIVREGIYVSFDNFDKKEAEAWIRDINPVSFPYYKKAKIEWFTNSKLVYRNAIGEKGIRGVLRIQYFEDNNMLSVEANKIYEIDTEILVSNTDNYDNTTSIKLNEIVYLSNLREVE